LLWANAIGHIIGGEPDDLDLFGGVEFGDFLDEGWCGAGVVEDEGEMGFAVEGGDFLDDGVGAVELLVEGLR
jgi:hypothetical protein